MPQRHRPWGRRRRRRRIFGAPAGHLRRPLLRSSLTHLRCARSGARRVLAAGPHGSPNLSPPAASPAP